MRSAAIAVIGLLVLAAIATAQSPQIDPGTLLKPVAVQIDLRAVSTGERGLCHGFVGDIDLGARTAYIVTAKHCVQELVEGHRLLAPHNAANSEDLKISARVSFSEGLAEAVHAFMWSAADDVAILYADYPSGSTVRSYHQVCQPKCGYYTLQFFLPADIPIYSIVFSPGTNPIISTGRLLVDILSRVTVVLPAGPGTSGSPVIDGRGALVGILSAEAPAVKLVPGRVVEKLLESAGAYSQPSGSTPAAPTLAPEVTPSPTPAPPEPAAPAVAPLPPPPAVGSASFLVFPGQSVGPVSLGMQIQEVIARLGESKGSAELGDGTMLYRWFEPPNNSGIGVRAAQNGTVLRVWVLNDERYRTKEGLHVGSTEAEVRAALGAPTRVEFNAQGKARSLIYESLGLWFSIQLDQGYSFYDAVFDIGVQKPK